MSDKVIPRNCPKCGMVTTFLNEVVRNPTLVYTKVFIYPTPGPLPDYPYTVVDSVPGGPSWESGEDEYTYNCTQCNHVFEEINPSFFQYEGYRLERNDLEFIFEVLNMGMVKRGDKRVGPLLDKLGALLSVMEGEAPARKEEDEDASDPS